jgi:hypothetical protein
MLNNVMANSKTTSAVYLLSQVEEVTDFKIKEDCITTTRFCAEFGICRIF